MDLLNASKLLECQLAHSMGLEKYAYIMKAAKDKDVSMDAAFQHPDQVSDWERAFYTALYDVGIHTIPQYPVEKYKLDLAVVLSENRKLDIEVDGEMYHKQWNGELCYRDQIRNQRMFELGWDVRRFWVYQIRDDTEWCINQIKDWIEANAI